MGDKRRFEFVEGTSSKFWEVWVEGSEVHTQFGRIGAKGQSGARAEASPDAAAALRDKLIREKTGKGYQERTAGGAAGESPQVASSKPAKKSSGGDARQSAKTESSVAKPAPRSTARGALKADSALDELLLSPDPKSRRLGIEMLSGEHPAEAAKDHLPALAVALMQVREDHRWADAAGKKLNPDELNRLKELITGVEPRPDDLTHMGYDLARAVKFVFENGTPQAISRTLQILIRDGDDGRPEDDSLHLDDSRIRQVPEQLATEHPNLRSVSLLSAYLKEFPPALLRLKKLGWLNLYARATSSKPRIFRRTSRGRSVARPARTPCGSISSPPWRRGLFTTSSSPVPGSTPGPSPT